LGFHLFAVVHELKGVEEFKPFFGGEIYLDAQVISRLHLVVMSSNFRVFSVHFIFTTLKVTALQQDENLTAVTDIVTAIVTRLHHYS